MSRFPLNQGFSVHDAINRSYDLAMRSLRKETHALDISRRAAKRWYDFQKPTRWWRRPRTPQNPATKTDLAVYELMEPFKKSWVEDDSRALPGDAVDRWVLEAMVEYALGHQPMYMGVMIGNVLFSYHNTQVQRVLALLDKRLVDTDAKWKDREFRRARGFIINNLKPKNGKTKHSVSQFLTLRETTRENEPKRFKVRESSHADFAFVNETLNNLTPSDPGCPFPKAFYNGDLNVYDTDLESYIAPHLTPAAKGWVRKHVLLDPDCWEPIYKQLGFEEPERKLEMPDHSSHPRLNPGNHTPPPPERTPMNRSDMQLSPAMTEEIAKEAEDWSNQRRTFVASSIRVVVKGENCLVIPVNDQERRSGRFELDDGDNFIELHGANNSGSMLLRTLFVSWNENEIPKRSVRHVVKLASNGKLKLLISYHRGDSETPMSATVDATYIPKRDFVVWSKRTPKPVGVHANLKWASVAVLIAGAVWAGSQWWRRHKQGSYSTTVVSTTPAAATAHDADQPGNALATSQQPAQIKRAIEKSKNEEVVVGRSLSQRAVHKKADEIPQRAGIVREGEQAKSSETKSRTRRLFAPVLSVVKKVGKVFLKGGSDSATTGLRRPTVIVTDKNNRPIHGAGVYFKRPGSDTRKAEFVGTGEAGGNSDKKGEYKPASPLQLKTYDLVVKKDGFEDARLNGINVDKEPGLRLHVRLVPDGKTEGRLRLGSLLK